MKNVIIAVLALVGLSLALHVFGVFGTVATAPGRVVNKTLETNNIIHNYEWFYDVNAKYETRIAQVAEYAGYLKAESDPAEKARIRTEVSAVRQSCRDLVTQYNANSEKANRSIFKSNNLPEILSTIPCEVK